MFMARGNRKRGKNRNSNRKANSKRSNKKENDKKEISPQIRLVMEEIKRKDEFNKIPTIKLVDEGGLAYKVADAFKEDLKYTQLRNFYAHVKNIEMRYDSWDDIRPELYLLKPRLASKFVQGHVPYGFYALIELIISKIDFGLEKDKIKSFERFVQFFEATVAFHKYLGEE